MNWKIPHGILRANLALALLLIAPILAKAQTGSLIFERATIRITPVIAETSADETASVRAVSTYDIEQRPEDALHLEYIHTLNTLDATMGVMIVMNSPSIVAVPAMSVYTPVDVLFVADDGAIIKIMPSVVLADIQQTIQARVPIKAFLFLKSGEAAARDIRPRDVVSGKMFTPAPTVQE